MRHTARLIYLLLLLCATAFGQWRPIQPYNMRYYGIRADSMTVDVGINPSNGVLKLARGNANNRVELPRVVELHGQTSGALSAAIISFFRSDGKRTMWFGDGSSLDSNAYIAGNNRANIRFITSTQGQGNLDSYTIPMTITNPDQGGRVLVGDSSMNANIYDANVFSVRGNAQIYNTLNNAPQLEFSDGDSVRVSVGKLGQPEANLSFNMDYTTRIHRLYKTSVAASWLALGASGGCVQYAPATTSASDVWSVAGSPYALYWLHSSTNNAKVAVNSNAAVPYGDGNFYVKRSGSMPSITGHDDLVLDGHRTKGTAGAVYTNSYNTGNTLISFGGGKASVGGTIPVSTLHVQGSFSLLDVASGGSLTFGDAGVYLITNSAHVVTLPAASSCRGRLYKVRNRTAVGATISSVDIDGVGTTTIPANTFWEIVSNGTSWILLSRSN